MSPFPVIHNRVYGILLFEFSHTRIMQNLLWITKTYTWSSFFIISQLCTLCSAYTSSNRMIWFAWSRFQHNIANYCTFCTFYFAQKESLKKREIESKKMKKETWVLMWEDLTLNIPFCFYFNIYESWTIFLPCKI